MKVVLFCGGQGLRMRDYSDTTPKPLVPIGRRPILWNLMKYYAHYGHTDFILCLGHRAEAIKEYFLGYDERLSNDFVMAMGGRDIRLLASDIDDWTITFVDTGLEANIGERLLAVREHLAGEPVFMANYADGVTDLPLDDYLARFESHGSVAQMLSVPSPSAFHIVSADSDGVVNRIDHVGKSEVRINGGFFVFRQQVFDYMQEGEELVVEPFRRLIDAGQLTAFAYDGFWKNMDTFKDKQHFEELLQSGSAPWMVWKR